MTALEETSPRKRGRPRDLDVRRRVLTVAAAALSSVGFEAMTMEGLAEASGIAKRTLYRWWPTKSAVISDALLSGNIDVPTNTIPRTADVWADLGSWLEQAAAAMHGPYGEVLRASVAISAADPTLSTTLDEKYAAPARIDIVDRLSTAVADEQVSPGTDLGTVADLLMAAITYVGLTRADPQKLESALNTLRVAMDPPNSRGSANEVGRS